MDEHREWTGVHIHWPHADIYLMIDG